MPPAVVSQRSSDTAEVMRVPKIICVTYEFGMPTPRNTVVP